MIDTDVADWEKTWESMINSVGQDLSGGEEIQGADPIERSTIRRYLEPLEFDCALHYDPDVARHYGHPDVTAPYTSMLTFTIPAMWTPGQKLFTSSERDAQPAFSPINGDDLRIAPELTGFFATDIEMDFVRPPVAGERLSKRGNTLLSCAPKWISVGRGAFMTLEASVVSNSVEVIGRVRNTVFAYEPVGPPPAASRSRAASSAGAPGDPTDTAALGRLEPVEFPLTVYRLVMEAGANRDFNSIHHNSEYAKQTGAPEMYASTAFLLGMWERAVRQYIGEAGIIRSIKGFRMKKFNPVGTTVVVRGNLVHEAMEDQTKVVAIKIWCENQGDITVGPGTVTAAMPAVP